MKTLLIAFLSVLLIGSAQAKLAQIHYVKPLQASVHESPDSSSKVKFILAIGRKMIEFKRENGFIQVGIDKSGGLDGWIKESDVSPADPDGIKY